jgi:hypothetical protein
MNLIRSTKHLSALAILMILTPRGQLQAENEYPKALVSFQDFKSLVAEVEAHRAERLVDLDTFNRMAKEPGVVILDSRSKFRYDRIHIHGAAHLNFSDFTQQRLAEVIPSPDTVVLIYCNNNFEGNQTDFASKVVMRPSLQSLAGSAPSPETQFRDQATPLMLALNVPTYINLYGYGYRNVYELHERVSVDDPRIRFAGSIVDAE